MTSAIGNNELYLDTDGPGKNGVRQATGGCCEMRPRQHDRNFVGEDLKYI